MFSRESFNISILIKQPPFGKIIFDLKRSIDNRRSKIYNMGLKNEVEQS